MSVQTRIKNTYIKVGMGVWHALTVSKLLDSFSSLSHFYQNTST